MPYSYRIKLNKNDSMIWCTGLPMGLLPCWWNILGALAPLWRSARTQKDVGWLLEASIPGRSPSDRGGATHSCMPLLVVVNSSILVCWKKPNFPRISEGLPPRRYLIFWRGKCFLICIKLQVCMFMHIQHLLPTHSCISQQPISMQEKRPGT